MSALQWLATDEDEVGAEADVRALEAEWTLTEAADVEGEGGDVDLGQAVEDALRSFPPDEVLVAGGPDEDGDLEAPLRDFGLPVTRRGGSLPLRGRDRVRGARSRIAAAAATRRRCLLRRPQAGAARAGRGDRAPGHARPLAALRRRRVCRVGGSREHGNSETG